MAKVGHGAWTSQQLLDLAHGNGFPELTVRQLETFRGQRLLPRPERVGQDGITPLWLSPPITGRQLLRLCGLRRDRDTRDPHLLRVLLWLSGFDRPLDEVRSDLRDVLTEASDLIERELAKVARAHQLAGDPAAVRLQAVTLLADTAAGLRGADTVLRRLRSADGHRLPGVRVLLYLFLTGEAPPAAVGTADDLERAVGMLPRGRLDRVDQQTIGRDVAPAGPWHDGQPADLDWMASAVSLPALRHAVDAATVEDLAFARRAVAPLTRGLTFISRLTGVLSGEDNFAGLTLLRDLPKSAFHEPIIVALVVSLRHSAHADNLITVVEAVEGAWTTGSRLLAELFTMQGWLLRQQQAKGDPRHVKSVERVMDEFQPRQSRDEQSR